MSSQNDFDLLIVGDQLDHLGLPSLGVLVVAEVHHASCLQDRFVEVPAFCTVVQMEQVFVHQAQGTMVRSKQAFMFLHLESGVGGEKADIGKSEGVSSSGKFVILKTII